MTQNFKSARIKDLRATNINSYTNGGFLTIEDVVFETDNTISLSADKPSVKVISGKSILNNIDEISNGGSDIIINGFTFTGSGPLSSDINVNTAYFGHIEAYNKPTNLYIEMVDKFYLSDGLRFKGLTGNTDGGYNQTVMTEYEYSPSAFEMVLFKGKGNSDRIRLDALGSIVIQTGGIGGRVYGESDGVTRLTIDTTNISMTLPLKVNSILPYSGNILTLGSSSLNFTTGNLIISNNIDSVTLSTNTISEHTVNTGVFVDGVLLKDSTISITDMYTDHIYEKTPTNGVNIDGVLCKDSGILATSLAVSTFLSNNIGEFINNNGVTIDGVLCKDSVVTANNIYTTSIQLNTIIPINVISGLNIIDTNFTAGDITSSSGIFTASILKALGGINTDTIYETTLGIGITIDGVLIKDGNITCDVLTANVINGAGGGGEGTHNNLLSIQGGSSTERYHMTLSEYTNMTNMFTSGDVALNSITEKTSGVNVNGVLVNETLDSVIFNISAGKKYIFNINDVTAFSIE